MSKSTQFIITLLILVNGLSCQKADTKDRQVKSSDFTPTFQNLDVETINREPVSFKNILGDSPILVNFWATWCIPCIEEMDDLENLHKSAIGSPSLKIVSINMDSSTNLSKVRDYLESKSFSFPVYFDPDWKSIEAFKLQGFPESFLFYKGQLLEITDPETKINTKKVQGKRDWSSRPMNEALCQALKTCS